MHHNEEERCGEVTCAFSTPAQIKLHFTDFINTPVTVYLIFICIDGNEMAYNCGSSIDSVRKDGIDESALQH